MNRRRILPGSFRWLAFLVIVAMMLPLAAPDRVADAAAAHGVAGVQLRPQHVPALAPDTVVPTQTLVLWADQDTQISPQSDTPWGDEIKLYAWQTVSGNQTWWPLFHFDLAAVPPGAAIVSATLHLYLIQTDRTPLTIHRVTAAWDEHVDTWSSMSAWHEAGAIASLTPGGDKRYVVFDVTALAQGWLAGAHPNDGVLLKPAPAGGDHRIASKETADFGQRPYLELAVANPQLHTAADDFDPATGFTGSDGDQPWRGDWQELGEADGPASGMVRTPVVNQCAAGACLRIKGEHQSLAGRGLSRAVDLGGATGATLAFMARRTGGGGQINLELSTDGGVTWNLLQSYLLDFSDGQPFAQTFDITRYASGQTQLRFIGAGVTTANETAFLVDDVRVLWVRQGIGDRVWRDLDRDGAQDAGEPGLAGVTVALHQGTCAATTSPAYRTALTAADGSYAFASLAAEEYCVRVDAMTLPLNHTLTTNNAPLDVTLAADQYFAAADFGYAADQADDRLAVAAYAPCADAIWLQQLVQAYGATIISQNTATCNYTLQASPASLSALQAALAADPHVRHITPDALAHADFTPNDPDYNNPTVVYGPQQIGAPAAWDVTTGDPNLIVAIVDTGVDRNHPEFAGRLLPGYDFANKDADPSDDHGHGTHVAGIAAAGINNGIGMAGMAGNVKILPVKVLAANNTGWWTDVASGITWAVDQGAKVVNLSLGGSTDSQPLHDAVAYATAKNVVVVTAAGNGNTSDLFFPASYDEVLSLGATTSTGVRYSLSNYGPNVDAMAPGASIWSSYWITGTGSTYRYMSGTSMAAPHGTGLVALLLSINPNLTVSQVRSTILNTATDMGDPGVDALHGYGRINAAAAVSATLPSAPITPTTNLTATLAGDVNGNGQVDPGDTLRYLLTVANPTAIPLSNVVVSATAPFDASYVISSTRLSGIPVRDDAAPLTAFPLDVGGLNIGTVAPRNSTVVSFDGVVGPLPRGVYAVVGQAIVKTGSGTQTLQAITPVAGTLLQAAVSQASAQISQTLTYTFTTDYLGVELWSNVVVTAAVPAGTSYVADSASADGVQSGGVVTWALGSNTPAAPGVGSGSSASVALDSVTSDETTGNSITVPHSTSGTNRLMLVGVSILYTAGSEYVTSVTSGSQALLRVGSGEVAGVTRVEMWALKNPPIGAANAVVSLSGSVGNGATAGVATFTGVDPVAPYGSFITTTGNSTTPILSVPSTAGELVLDTVAMNRKGGTFAVGPGQTEQWSLRPQKIHGAGSTEPGAASVTMSWVCDTSGQWVIGAVALSPQKTILGNVMSAAPTLATSGSLITVTQALTASLDIANVSPTALTITATNGVTATLVSGPTPASATVGVTGTTFTWVYRTAGSSIGQLTFGGGAAGGGYTWPPAQSNSVIVHPPLAFRATVAGAPAGGGPIHTTGFIRDALGRSPSNASNTPTTGLFGSIGDRIWNDRDADGIQDNGEPGLPGVTVQLTTTMQNALTVTTDANGRYVFSDLPSGVYTVTLDQLSVPPDFEALTTRYPIVVNLHDGEPFDGADVGLRARATVVGDTLWYDADADGRQDAGEPGIGNVTLDLYFDDGDGLFNPTFDTLVDTTTSDTAGAYRLNAPVDGVYFVNVTDQAGLLANLQHTIGPQSLTDPSPAIALAVGQFYRDADFGYVRVPGVGNGLIGDLVWADGNGDGVREVWEPALIGVEVCATPTAGGTPLCAATDNNGRYLIAAPAAEYSVAPSGTPVGLLPSTPSRWTVDLAVGQQQLAVDFGFGAGAAPLGGIGGTVWQDLPANGAVDGVYTPATEPGIPEVSVSLIKDSNGDGVWAAGEPYLATYTTIAGVYSFDGLPAGAYLVRVTDTRRVLRRFLATLLGPLGASGADHQNKAQPYPVALAAGAVDTTGDFGYREYEVLGVGDPPPPGLVGNLVWLDADADGQYDPAHGDLPLAGVTLAVRDAGGSDIATTTTGADGAYLFSDLVEGDYSVRVTDAFGVLAGLIPTVASPAPGQDNTNRPQPYTVTLGLDPVSYTADFGYTRPAAISGLVFYDQNANHVQDLGETLGLDGVELKLTNLATAQERTTVSVRGVYTFTGLLPGGYRLQAPLNVAGVLLTTDAVVTVTVGVGGASGTSFGYVAPTATPLSDFAASVRGGTVQLTWQVMLWGQTAPAFDVWRSAGGASWKRLTAGPVEWAERAGETASYRFEDAAIERGITYLYRLESTTGASFGPWAVRVPAADGARCFLPLMGR